jgi:ribosomal protein L7/L12
MATIVVTRWHPGFNKVAFTKLLHERCGLGLAIAKSYTDKLLSGGAVTFDVPADQKTEELAAKFTELGTTVHIKETERTVKSVSSA